MLDEHLCLQKIKVITRTDKDTNSIYQQDILDKVKDLAMNTNFAATMMRNTPEYHEFNSKVLELVYTGLSLPTILAAFNEFIDVDHVILSLNSDLLYILTKLHK